MSVKSSFPELRARPWPGTREEAFLEMSRGKTRLWCGSSNVVFSMVSLKVDNLTYRTTNRDLEYLFEKYGKVSRLVFLIDIFYNLNETFQIGDIYIPRDKYSKESRGFAFVRFLDRRDAEDAMDSLDGRKYDGREIRIQMAKYARPEPSRRRSRSRSRDRSSRRRSTSSRSRSRSRSRSPRRSKRYSRSKSGSRRSRSGSKSRSRDRSQEKRKFSRSKSGSKSRQSRSKSKSRSKENDSKMKSKSKSRGDSRSKSKSRSRS